MVNDSIAALGGKDTAKEGWEALFSANKAARNMNGSYEKGEKIASRQTSMARLYLMTILPAKRR